METNDRCLVLFVERIVRKFDFVGIESNRIVAQNFSMQMLRRSTISSAVCLSCGWQRTLPQAFIHRLRTVSLALLTFNGKRCNELEPREKEK
jgi:hypothetical protein